MVAALVIGVVGITLTGAVALAMATAVGVAVAMKPRRSILRGGDVAAAANDELVTWLGMGWRRLGRAATGTSLQIN